MNDRYPASRFSVLAFVACFFSALCAFTITVQAASDADVLNIEPTNVIIEKDKIFIVGKATVRMRVFASEGDQPEEASKFFGRDATWVVIAADNATFTVLRPEKGKDEWWEKMSLDAAKALKNGEKIERIGFYRPDVTIRRNAIHSINGYGYIYPKRDE